MFDVFDDVSNFVSMGMQGKDNTSGLWMALNQLKSGKISRAADCFLRECNVEGMLVVARSSRLSSNPLFLSYAFTTSMDLLLQFVL